MKTTVPAMISWIPSRKGGRAAPPTGPTYSTIARFDDDAGWPDPSWTLVVKFVDSFGAGRYTYADIGFLVDDGPNDVLLPDARFQLFEGRRIVATGVVVGRHSPRPTDARSFEELLLV